MRPLQKISEQVISIVWGTTDIWYNLLSKAGVGNLIHGWPVGVTVFGIASQLANNKAVQSHGKCLY